MAFSERLCRPMTLIRCEVWILTETQPDLATRRDGWEEFEI